MRLIEKGVDVSPEQGNNLYRLIRKQVILEVLDAKLIL